MFRMTDGFVLLRVLQERIVLAQKMAEDARQSGRPSAAMSYDDRVEEYQGHVDLLRKVLG